MMCPITNRVIPMNIARLIFASLATALLGIVSLAAAAPPGRSEPPQVVTFGGGNVMLRPEVQALYYGQSWGNDPRLNGQTGQFERYLQFIVNSSYMDMLTTAGYDDGKGHLIGRGNFIKGLVSPATLNKNLTDDQIRAELKNQIKNNGLAGPDPNRLYVVFVEPNVIVSYTFNGQTKTSTKDFSGYHWGFQLQNAAGQWVPVNYAVIPYPGGTAGNLKNAALTDFQSMTETVSHELAEAATDATGPNPGTGWTNKATGQEIGDIVEFLPDRTVLLNGYAVQKVSDKSGRAIAPIGSTPLRR
jgi:hypothetical protein